LTARAVRTVRMTTQSPSSNDSQPTTQTTADTSAVSNEEKSARRHDREARKTLQEILRSQLQVLRDQHQRVLGTQDPDAIHKMRVATRRAQASLDLLQMPGDRLRIRAIKRTLRRSRRVLSTVRNYDVFLELIDREAATQRGSRGKRFELLRKLLAERRARRMTVVQSYLRKLNLSRIEARIGVGNAIPAAVGNDVRAASEEPSEGMVNDRAHLDSELKEPSRQPAFDQRLVALHTADRLEQRVAEFQVLAAQAHPSTHPVELHQLRIAAKRVRYLLEIVSEMRYGDATRAIAWLRSLQDRIGDWHDLEALEDEIAGIVSRPRFLKRHLLESSVMLEAAAHLQKKKLQLVSRLFPVRVPKLVGGTAARLARSLRRSAIRNHSTAHRAPAAGETG